MTPQERQILEEAEQQAFETSQELYNPETTGIRPPPTITETITELEGNLFGLEFEKFPEAEVLPIEEGGGGFPNCDFAATLVCDSVSASRSKCGFTEYASPSDPPKYYLVEDYSSLRTISPLSCLDSNHHFTCDPELTCIATRNITYDSETCVPTTTGSSDPGAAGNTAHEVLCDGTVIDPAGDCHDLETTIRFNGVTTQTTIDYTPADDHHTNTGCTPVDVTLHLEGHIALSDEYTTDMLISNTEGSLPSYSDCFGCGDCVPYPDCDCGVPNCSCSEDCLCNSYRNLSDDEVDYSITRTEYKFIWDDPAPANCTLRWCIQTTDLDGNVTGYEEMTFDVETGSTESDVFELLEPPDNGYKYIIYPIVGACCIDHVCDDTHADQESCENDGGTWQGNCTDCDTDPCL